MTKKENLKRKDTEYQIKKLSSIVESADDAIISISLDDIVTSWNKSAELIYGYSANDILGKNISILEPPTLFEETKELAELIKQNDRIHHYETLRLRKDGKIINVSLTLSPIFDDSENLTEITIIARDITKIKQTEEKLQKSREIYRSQLEQTGQVMYDYDFRTDKCTWTGAIEKVTGYSSEAFQKLGKYIWSTIIQPLNTNRIYINSHKKGKTGDKFKEELRLRRKDGTYIYVENKGIYLKDNEGNSYGVLGVIEDITDLKLALEKVEETENKYKSFIQNFRGIVFQADKNFSPIFLQGAVEKVTGYRKEDFSSRVKWIDLIYPDDLSFILEEAEKIKSSQSDISGEIEYRINHRDGQIRWVNEIYHKSQEKNGKPGYYQSAIYDITERKSAEEALSKIETSRKQEIHHRIKNNLQVICSLLDLQAEKFSDRECIQKSEVLEAFKESQDRVISMALIHEELYKGGRNDKLDFSMYIQELVNSLFSTYRLRSIDITFTMDVGENIFFDMDTAVPLGIIVNELVSNSFKHAFVDRDKGEIKIKLIRDEIKECKIEDCNITTFIMSFSDNGIGIPEDLDIEDPDSLGLQIVTSLVDQLDGELELKRNKGTEFTIRFTVTEE